MYARLVTFQFGSATRGQVEQLGDHFAPLFRRQQGFRTVTFLTDAETGEAGTFSLWDSRQDAEAAGGQLRPELQATLRQMGLQLQGQPTTRLFEVYEPTM